MKLPELDLTKIAKLAEKKEDENFKFRAFLKGQDSEKVDHIVHRLNDEISAKINCQECGNCCKSLNPCVSQSEIKRLSGIISVSKADFEARYVEINHMDKVKFLKDIPCKFLDGKRCSIYSDCPEDCKSYPHIHKNGFTSRTIFILGNYGICPIVFNVFENLKIEFGFKN